jgi:hypothetical protein
MIQTINQESQKLAEIHDYLLPKLLVREIGVAAEADVAATIIAA